MSSDRTLALYSELVRWVSDVAPEDWRRVEINMEVLADGQEVSNSWVVKCFVGEALEKQDYSASGARKLAMRDRFIELSDLSAKTGDRWTVCDFTVFSSGKYDVAYSYDAPPRLSGDLVSGT